MRKLWLISKFMGLQIGQKIITIHRLSSIWRSKDNQTMKLCQLIKYNMRNAFFEKPNTKLIEEATTIPFYKKSKLSMSSNQKSKMLYSFFLLYVLVEVYQNMLKLKCRPLVFTLHKAFFKKNKRGLKLVSLPHVMDDYWREIFFTLYFINWSNFIVWLPLPLEILSNMFIIIICFPVCDVINFEINRSFFINLLFYKTKKSGQKCRYLKNKKSFWHEIKSNFQHFKKDFQLLEIDSDSIVSL